MRALILLLALLATPAFAVQPDEMLPDPVLEARARSISENLRCPVCQGEAIDDSNAPISRSLRLAVRERLVAGDSDDQVVDYVVARFGEFVLCLTAIGPSATLRMGPDSPAAQHLRDAAQALSQRLGAPAAAAGGH